LSLKLLAIPFEQEDRKLRKECSGRFHCKSTRDIKLFLETKAITSNFLDLTPIYCSNRKYSIIESYAAVTHQGLIRNYNEDSVTVVINIEKPYNKVTKYWLATSFFGLYDGHEGNTCAEYLRDNLHHAVMQSFIPLDS
jgi:hypothetical protein